MLAARRLAASRHFDTPGDAGLNPLREAQVGGIAAAAELTEAVTDRSRDAASDPADASAEMFNEHGFFAAGLEHLQVEASPAQKPCSEAAAQEAMLPPDASWPEAMENLPFADTQDAMRASPALLPDRAALRGGLAAAALLPVPAVATPPRPGEPAVEIEPAPEAGPVARPARGVITREGDRSVNRVAVSEAEQDMAVVVETAALDERERERLRDEIAAMLARHGRRVSDIQINTRSPSRTDAEEN